MRAKAWLLLAPVVLAARPARSADESVAAFYMRKTVDFLVGAAAIEHAGAILLSGKR